MPGNTPMSAVEIATPPRQRNNVVQRRRACSRRMEGNATLTCGQACRFGPIEHADPLVVRAVATVDVSCRRVLRRSQEHQLGSRRIDGRDPRRFRPTDRRATPCAAGRPEPRSWARHARGAAIDDGSGRWTRPLDAHQIAAKRSGQAPPPREALREPAGSQSSLPDDLPLLRLKTLVSQLFTSGGWWGNATAPTSSALLLSLRLYPQRRAESRPSFGRRAASAPARHTARLHQRPSVHPTVTASPKQSETRAEVTTSDSGPDATSAPLETSAPWVKPGGISSQ